MPRVELDVPFSEKDEAKSLGARWDPKTKVWYVPDGKEISPFVRWLPMQDNFDLEHEPEFRIRSPHYFLVESKSDCWKCGNRTRVFAFMLPEVHEQFQHSEDDEDEFSLASNLGSWESYGYRGTISGVYGLSSLVAQQLRLHTEHYKSAYSKTAGRSYYMNHCEQCGAKLGDFFMHGEPGGAFFPTSPTQASRIILRKINAKFNANGSIGYTTPDFMEYMQLIKI